MAARR